MNGLNVFQIKAHSKYGLSDFYEDLRDVMKRVALKGEKVCFIFDEASAFIEDNSVSRFRKFRDGTEDPGDCCHLHHHGHQLSSSSPS